METVLTNPRPSQKGKQTLTSMIDTIRIDYWPQEFCWWNIKRNFLCVFMFEMGLNISSFIIPLLYLFLFHESLKKGGTIQTSYTRDLSLSCSPSRCLLWGENNREKVQYRLKSKIVPFFLLFMPKGSSRMLVRLTHWHDRIRLDLFQGFWS